VGCGNPFAGDDSVGLEIVHRLQVCGGFDCECRELSDDNLGLLEFFASADLILFLDAVQTGAPAGTLHLVPLPSPDIVPRALGTVSSHGWGLDEAIRMARALGRRLPRLMLLGIELENVTPGAPRTPPVNAALETVVENFQQLQGSLLDNNSPLWSGHHSFAPGSAGLGFANATPRVGCTSK
jgi:hydrogenase maturation protease